MAKKIKRDHIDQNDTDGWKEYYNEEKPKKGENEDERKKREARNKKAKMKAHDTWMRKGSKEPPKKEEDKKPDDKKPDDKKPDDKKPDDKKPDNKKPDNKKNDTMGGDKGGGGKKKSKEYPFIPLSFIFRAGLEDGKPDDLQFQEVSGLSISMGTEDLMEGGNQIVYKLPSRIQYENLILKRAIIPDKSEIAKWCRKTLDGGISRKIELKNLKIELLSPTKMKPLMKWSVEGAYPIKWEISSLNAQESALVIETMEFVFRKLTVEAV